MTLALGVDTGGTYTDAVLVRDERDVVAFSKALTTRHDLAEGIGEAVEAVLREAGVSPQEISLASLSTTLATNALVEGQGGRAGLILIGFGRADLERHGLQEALGSDPVLLLGGGHNHAGEEAADFDEDALRNWLADAEKEVTGYAVAAQFATRNPAHEMRAAALLRELTGKPVSASHHLSSKLNGPKRAVTALLNARLIGMIDGLIARAEMRLNELDVKAPLMVVRGDGALISANVARARPIETILSGPAASIVGARWLTGAQDALVSDIGGTTTDIAVLRDGRPAIDPEGAQVGPHRTMVEAVAMRTFGLGGDSEVHFNSEGLKGGVALGPRRLLPVSLIAREAPEVVHAALDDQLRRTVPGEYDGRFVRALSRGDSGGLGERDAGLLARIGETIVPLGAVLRSRLDRQALRRLVERGLVQVAGVTPTDASHVLGYVETWDKDAACKALTLFGRRRTGAGKPLASDPKDMARMIIDRLTEQSVLALLETGFAEEAEIFGVSPDVLAQHVLMQRGLDGHRGILRLDAGLNLPVIGLGASAASYYPAVGARLGCQVELPRYAGVANAIGAVVGRITIRRSGEFTVPAEGRFRVHLGQGPEDFATLEQALSWLESSLAEEARRDVVQAGAEDVHLVLTHDLKHVEIEGRQTVLSGTVTAEASGRPRIAEG